MAFNLFDGVGGALTTRRTGQEDGGSGGNGLVGSRGSSLTGSDYLGSINPYSASAGMDAVIGAMHTSAEEEGRLRRASAARERVLAVADAIRHLGNIAHTVNYAPSQTFNTPAQDERLRYERGKALRDAANARYYTYQQARAAQDAKQKQWAAEQKQKADQWNATFQFNVAKAAADQQEKQRQFDETLALNKRKADDTKAANEARQKYQDRMASIAGMNAQTNRMRAKAYINRTSSGGGRSGGVGGQPVRLRGKNGFYSRTMRPDERNSFYNQTYDELVRRGIIKQNEVLAGLPANIFGEKTLSSSAMRRAVDDALMTHPEVGDWLRDEYEFEFEPREGGDWGDGGDGVNGSNGRFGGNVFTPYWSSYGGNAGGGRSLGLNIGGVKGTTANKKLGIGL